MPSNAYTSAGTEIYISSEVPDTISGPDFRFLDYKEIGEVTDISEFGKQVDTLSYREMRSDRTIKVKGNYDLPNMNITVARIPTNEGQSELVSALQNKQNYSFRLFVPEPDTYYFTGQILNYTTQVGGPNQIVSAVVTVAMTSDIVLDEDYFVVEYGYWDDRGLWFDTDKWNDGV